jgi:hypothetical protein
MLLLQAWDPAHPNIFVQLSSALNMVGPPLDAGAAAAFLPVIVFNVVAGFPWSIWQPSLVSTCPCCGLELSIEMCSISIWCTKPQSAAHGTYALGIIFLHLGQLHLTAARTQQAHANNSMNTQHQRSRRCTHHSGALILQSCWALMSMYGA